MLKLSISFVITLHMVTSVSIPESQTTFSNAKLNKIHDKASLCLTPIDVHDGSDNSAFPKLMGHEKLLKYHFFNYVEIKNHKK
jgi:hypothetical protein